MEPMNCTVHVRPDSCEVWGGIQVLTRAQAIAAKVTGLQGTGSCCSFVGAKVRIPVTAGAHYWVAVTTDPGGTDTFANWAFNTTDQLDALPSAVNKGSGWVTNGGAVPAASFAVYGN